MPKCAYNIIEGDEIMLIEFSVTNFLSFKDRNTFTMIASSDNTLKDNYVETNNEKILKITAMYGANASGKTNLFKILVIVSSMIKHSNFFGPNVMLPIVPFKLDKETVNKPSEFEIKFLVDGIRYVYGFKADRKNVYEEYLTYYPNGRPVKIFTRENIDNYSFNASDAKFLNDLKEKNTSNKFFVSTATNWNYEKTKPAFDFLTEKLGIVMSYEQINNYSYNMYYNDKNKTLENFALNFLEKADFNIKGYKIIEEKMTEDKLRTFPDIVKPFIPVNTPMYKVNTKHIVNGDEYEFDISEESLGTQVIFSFIPVLKDVLDNGKVLVIDEFDKSLHPFIVKYIVEIFNDLEINKKGAQLIFNTHDTNLLDLELLRRDQIWFTEKNSEDGSTTIYPLDDFSVRKTENVEKGYLLGRYGAIPFLENNFDSLK